MAARRWDAVDGDLRGRIGDREGEGTGEEGRKAGAGKREGGRGKEHYAGEDLLTFS